MPVWATLIALMVEDEVVAGVVSAPALGRRWWAAKGGGALTGKSLFSAPGAASATSGPSRTPRCRTPRFAAGSATAGCDDFIALTRGCWRSRAYGDFWSHMLVAEGAVDIAAEPELSCTTWRRCP